MKRKTKRLEIENSNHFQLSTFNFQLNQSKAAILNRLKAAPPFRWEYPDKENFERDNGFDAPELLLESFVERLNAVGGKSVIINNKEEFSPEFEKIASQDWGEIHCSCDDLFKLLKNSKFDISEEEPENGNYSAAITKCECLIGLTGSVLVSSYSGNGRKAHIAPDVHIVYAGVSQIKPFIKDGFAEIEEKPSWIGLITGPSRTADIEKTLVLGAHGPKELIVFIDKSC